MANYEIRPLQLRILNVLEAFDKICKEHGLTYYLWAGTMLGAVRHKGFIPWDDDADVAMPRKDYETLLEHASEWIPRPYELNCSTFSKFVDSSTTVVERFDLLSVGGIYVDIFPLDEIRGKGLLSRLHTAHYSFLVKITYFCNRNPYKHGHGPSSWLPLLIQKLYTNDQLIKKTVRLMKKYSDSEYDYYCDHNFSHRGIMPKSYFGKPQPVIFEGKELSCVEFPDKCLTLLYGDYMQIPPEEKRKQHQFYYLNYDLPYREYKDDRVFR